MRGGYQITSRRLLVGAAICAVCVLTAAGCSNSGAPGARAPAGAIPQLRRDGRWLVDQHGRVVLSHGVNLVWKNAPFVPPDAAGGFTRADADWLVQHGFNTARIGTLWVGVSPHAAGAIDTSYLNAWDRVVQLLAARGIWMLFDFHQDMLAPVYQGEGVPEWAVEAIQGPATALLGSPMFGFPFNYFTPQVSEAFDNLWAEQGTVWDGFRDAWMAVALKWRNQPYSMGYDLLNEPWSGQEWPSCIFPPMLGCPSTDETEIQPFFEHAIKGIRTVDPDNLVWLEPQLLAGGTGAPTGLQPIPGELQLGYSIHNYCPLTALAQAAQLGLPVEPPVGPQDTCPSFEADVVEQARVTAERIGAAELITEFGASDDLVLLARVTNLADANLIGWQYWHYKNWSDPTTQSQQSNQQSLFDDDTDLSTVKLEKLKLLSRPYPQATAGIPAALEFNPETGEFTFRYAPRAASAPTEIFVPVALHYPNGYSLELTGARSLSPANAARVNLEALPGVAEVTVRISRP